MKITKLNLTNFRNIGQLDLALSPGFNCFYGENGQGKTNLLEAAYVLVRLKSFRARRSALVKEGMETAVIDAVAMDGETSFKVRQIIGTRGQSRVLVEGKPVRSIESFMSSFRVILFVPEDVYVPSGPPEQRRRLLDRAIFNVHPVHFGHLLRYRKALRSRNVLLRDGAPASQIRVYDHELSRSGVEITASRARCVARLSVELQDVFEEMGVGFGAGLRYLGGWATSDGELAREELRKAMMEALEEGFSRDLARGSTGVGPHRDDVEMSLDGRSMKGFASQGQHRIFMLGLKVAEVRLLGREQEGTTPLMLLDDLSSELDMKHNDMLFEALDRIDSQVLLSTTSRKLVRSGAEASFFRIEDGKALPD